MSIGKQDWSALARTARHQFRQGRFDDAADLYESALAALAARLREEFPTPGLILAQIETLHAQARALARLDRLPEAEAAHARAHAFVHGLATAPRVPAALRRLAIGLCALTLSEWRSFRAEHARRLETEGNGGALRGAGAAAVVH